MASTLTHLVQQAVSERIGNGTYKINELLPSHDRLAKELNCSPATAERALRVLRRAGILKGIRHKGTIVVRRPPKALIALILSADAHINDALQDSLCNALAAANFDIEMVPTAGGKDVVHRWCTRLVHAGSRPDYMVELLPSLARNHVEYEEVLQAFPNRITLSLDADPQEPTHPMITIDPVREAAIICDYLLGKGHTRIAIWAEHTPELLLRSQGRFPLVAKAAMEYMESKGGEAVPIFGPNTPEKLKPLVHKQRVTALYDLNDHLAVSTMMNAYRAGLRIPEDLAIVGRHDTPHALSTRPTMSSLSINPLAISKTIIRAINDLINDKVPKLYYVTPFVVERESA